MQDSLIGTFAPRENDDKTVTMFAPQEMCLFLRLVVRLILTDQNAKPGHHG